MTLTPRQARLFTGTLALSLLASCGGGGGGAAAQPAGNLSVNSVRLLSSGPNAAHEMRLSTTIFASREYTDVPVTYVLLNKEDVDNEVDDVRQYEVSTAEYAQITAGVGDYEGVVTIPDAVREDDEWYLIPHIDSANAIPETDEEDNLPTDGSKIYVKIGSANSDRADIVIESAEVDEDAVILYPMKSLPMTGGILDRDDHDFSATLVMTTTGSKTLTNVDVQASIAIPGGNTYRLFGWDEVDDRYENEIRFDITPGIPNTVHMDILLPNGSARTAVSRHIAQGQGNKFKVLFSSNMTAGVTEWENGSQRHGSRGLRDNQIEAEVIIILPPNTAPVCNGILWNKGFKKNWANKVFSVGVDFGSSATLDTRGAIAQAHAAVPTKLFGKSSNALDLRAFGRVTPRQGQPTDSEFTLDFEAFGVSLFSLTNNDPSYSYDKTMSWTKSREVRGRMFAGPIPLEVRAKASGTMGYRVSAFLDPARMEVIGSAFANLKGLAEASASAVVIKAGIGGSITLLSDTFTARGEAQLGIPSAGKVTGTLTMEVTNDLRGPTGRLYLFEEHHEPKWCYKVVPCGVRKVRNEKTIARFKTFRKKDVLFSETKTATVCVN